MTNLNVSLPDKLRSYVEDKVDRKGYGTISEYIRELIRADEQSERDQFESFIAQAYASGDPVPHTKADIEKARAETHRRIAAKRKAK